MRAGTYFSVLAGCGLATACSITSGVKTTFYGVPDNDPAGSDAIAFSCGPRGFHAGGTGTYSDPLTFASQQGGPYAQCEIIYAPYLKKYLRHEDICGACTGVWIDVFTGNSQNGGNTQVQCENSLTPNAQQSVIRSPATNLAVDTAPLFSNGQCNTGHVYPSNNPSSYCGGSGGGGGSGGCQTGCSWAGHCAGCACATFDDCSDDLVCNNGICG